MIEVHNIHKSYEEVEALSQINVQIKPAELFGFIGPDGAGKTTLFRLIATLLLPDEGYIKVSGLDAVKDYKAIRKILGYMPGRFSLYQDLSVEENLNFYADIFGSDLKENYYLIAPIYEQLAPFKDRLAGKLSGGMKQKLALCCALIHKPEILILDEPTTGVDAVSRKEFWEMLQQLKKENITIIVSTPYMDEAALCDRVALMQKGNIMAIDKPSALINNFPNRLFQLYNAPVYDLLRVLDTKSYVENNYAFGQKVHLLTKDSETSANDIRQDLIAQFPDISITQQPANIEDCFIHLMQKNNQHGE